MRFPRSAHAPALLVLFGAALAAAACTPEPAPQAPPPPPPPAPQVPLAASTEPAALASPAFAETADRVLKALIDMNPSMGRDLGLHEYDGRLADRSAKGIEANVRALHQLQGELAAVDEKTLGDDARLDLAMLRREVASSLFGLEDLELWKHRPQYYEELFSVNAYLDRAYAPIEERAKALVTHEEAALAQVPSIRANLKTPMSKPVLETAVKNYRGFAEYLRGDVVRLLKGVGDAAFQARFKKANDALAAAASDVAAYLASEVPHGDASHVLGAEKYKKLLLVQEGLSIPLEQFKKMAEDDLATNRKAYEELQPKVKVTRPPVGQLLAEATSLTAKARQFLVDKHIVTIPADDPARVMETPPYMRWNAASLNPPGPFEPARGVDAFYYITLPDKSWPVNEQTAYVMTRGSLVATTVHEVYPGHFLQSLWIRKAPTRVQKALGSYSFVEGWAHYSEQMMVEEGFLADDPQIRLGQLHDALLRDCRYLASYGMHVEGMSVEAAQKRFIDECHQEKPAAREQAIRGTFDPGYFAYTLGKLQILALRAEAKEKLKEKFSLQRFHDTLLAHGSPPVALVHDRVLKELE